LQTHIPHVPVLYDEVLEIFSSITDGYIIDCTLGYAGHSFGIISSNKNINLICNDQDDTAINFSKERLSDYSSRIIFNKGNFKDVIHKFKDKNITGILADIGVSSLQLDNNNRGFSFTSDSLDMRMDQKQTLNAKDIVNTYSSKDLEFILKEYGEVREYKKVANLIIQNRPFQSSKELAKLFEKNLFKKANLHPATLPFQAIRIAVNNELGVLEELFNSIKEANLSDCLVAIISFHSLEDRIVKNHFKSWSKKCVCPSYIMKCECGNNNQIGKILTKKPIIPTKKEIQDNPRSRSSKMRIFEIK
jgi:16S rRNA (cytosine1402-N4)-methyltransferase